MHSTNQSTGRFSVVEPHQVHGSVGPADPETLGPRVLELAGILQTTLELDQMIALFAKNIQAQLQIEGLEYENTELQQKYQFGSTATHRATYDLVLEEQRLGGVRFFRDLPFTGKELRQLENLLCALVYPLRNALSYLSALQMASHDPLTGVQNRLALEGALQREVDLAHRQAAPLSMLVIDADHFKRFNDTYGHAFGDEVLRALAGALSATVRRSDLLFRYGGEEFVILASHTSRDGAALLAERLRQAVNQITTISGRDIALSVSIGVAELAEGETAEELFKRADDAVYQAKEKGRNCVVIA
ncbi:MAG: GGDEF domain-containing protein [Gammaproteobacteria bacterium]|nr:MAG: GGDEF domain-containing protein [Gammaproteobacteria bacterium]